MSNSFLRRAHNGIILIRDSDSDPEPDTLNMKSRPWATNAARSRPTNEIGEDGKISEGIDENKNITKELDQNFMLSGVRIKTVKEVRFLSAGVSSTHAVLSRKEYTAKEISLCWYKDKDIDKTLTRCRKLLSKLDRSETAKETFSGSRRGLENQTDQGRATNCRLIKQMIKTVLAEQWLLGSIYEDEGNHETRIATASLEVSAGGISRALRAGNKDKEEALKVFAQDNSSEFNNLLENVLLLDEADTSGIDGTGTNRRLASMVAAAKRKKVTERQQSVQSVSNSMHSLPRETEQSMSPAGSRSRPSLAQYLHLLDPSTKNERRKRLRRTFRAACFVVQLSNYIGGQGQSRTSRPVRESRNGNSEGELKESARLPASLENGRSSVRGFGFGEVEEEKKEDDSESSSGSENITADTLLVSWRETSSVPIFPSSRCSTQTILHVVKTDLSARMKDESKVSLKEYTEKQRTPVSTQFQAIMLEEAMQRETCAVQTQSKKVIQQKRRWTFWSG